MSRCVACVQWMVTAVVWSTAYSQKPNVVILLVDDLGYGDLGYTGIPAHFVAQLNVYFS
jgi:hypothetical protein